MKRFALVLCLLAGVVFSSLPAHGAGGQHSATVSQLVGGGETVPFQLAKDVATSFAEALSTQGEIGPVYTYYGVDGKPSVYVFVFSLKETSFPKGDEILKKVALGWEVYQKGKEIGDQEGIEKAKKMITGQGDFLTIVVSARKELGPVVEYFYGLPLHYSAREKALKIALDNMGKQKAGLSQVIFCSPFDIWFEFTSGAKRTYVSPFLFTSNTAEEVFLFYPMEMAKQQREKIKSDWEKVESGKGFDLSLDQFRITGVPDFDWSYGCSPSAGADVLGYWDANGYDLLIDYYFDRYDAVEHETDYDVPNVQQQLSWAMNTDSSTGGTSLSDIGSGIRMVCNHPDYENNYGFEDWTDYDQSLGYLINEIRSGYPAVWNVFSHPTYGNHSMCAMGWGPGPPDTNYICVHDTWSSTPEERLVNWYGWSNERYTVAVHPGSASVYSYNNIHANNASMNITNYGAIGDETNQDFVWNGTDQLFDGTLILAWVVPGDTMIAMDMFNTHVKDSWYPYDALTIVDTTFGEFGWTAFIDTIGLGLVVEQYSVGSSDPAYGDFILQQYVVKNSADTSMKTYVSLSMDWDLFDAYDNDSWGDSLHNLAWHWCPGEVQNSKYKFGAMRIPTDEIPVIGYEAVSHQYYIYPQEGWRDDQLWQLITKAQWQDDSSGYDISLLLTPGRRSLGPDSAHLESFIIFGVDTTQHLIGPEWWKSMLRFCGFYRGDVNEDGVINIGDVVFLVNYLFTGGTDPLPFEDQGDVNDDEVVNVADVIYLLNYLFTGGACPIDYNRFLPQPWRGKFVRTSLFANPNWQ
jgi:hypothetical protein